MFEVPDEVMQADHREDEDEKKEQEDEKEEQADKKQEQEEKTLYELDNLYRTMEKRFNKSIQNYVANSFGLIEKLGEGKSIFIHAVFDPTLDSGTVTIRNDA